MADGKGKVGRTRRSGASTIPPRRRFRAWLRALGLCSVTLLLVQFFLAGSTLDAHERGWKRVLLVTAHPDDEAMFFAPVILSLLRQKVNVYGLCLSNGNAESKGLIRANELKASYNVLGVGADQITLIDDVAFPDGMEADWDTDKVVEAVQGQMEHHGPFDALITFDQHGITRHANHVACHRAVERIASEKQSSYTAKAYVLRSLSVLTKFFGLPGAIVRFATSKTATFVRRPTPDTIIFLSTPLEYVQALRAMAQHRSQLVWFRYLYVLFSGYMYGVQLFAL